jgi:hypothetical protein
MPEIPAGSGRNLDKRPIILDFWLWLLTINVWRVSDLRVPWALISFVLRWLNVRFCPPARADHTSARAPMVEESMEHSIDEAACRAFNRWATANRPPPDRIELMLARIKQCEYNAVGAVNRVQIPAR